jgi:hypothetical protein
MGAEGIEPSSQPNEYTFRYIFAHTQLYDDKLRTTGRIYQSLVEEFG